jgi:hypothetical protein
MKISSNTRRSSDLHLIEGFQKHLDKGWSLVVAGKKYTGHDIVDLLQRRIDALHAVSTAKAAWVGARRDDEALNAETVQVVLAVRQNVLVMFNQSPDTLADFGLAPRKARRALTPDELVQRTGKAKATREARHTMGKRQKQAIHGNAAHGALPAAAPPEAPSPPAASPTVNGGHGAVNGSPPSGGT